MIEKQTQTLNIIGYGNQAKAWADNLYDSGYKVEITLRSGSKTIEDVPRKFEITSLEEVGTNRSKTFAVLTPDHTHAEIIEKISAQNNEIKHTFIFAHGLSDYQNQFSKKYHHNFILIAPKAIGVELRKEYKDKGLLGGVYSCEYAPQL